METEPAPPPDPAADTPPPAGNGPPPVRVLLIDDDRDDYFLTQDLIADAPRGRYTLDWAPTYAEGLDALCGGTHDAYLLDYRLGARTGIELLREAAGRGYAGPVIVLTGQGQSKTDLEALDAGAYDYLEKGPGLTPALLERAIRYAIAQRASAAELERKVRERTDELARANEALLLADRRKDEFLSTLGHELRNPLAPILNGLEIMRLAPDDAGSVARQRERLERQVAQMVRLVDDLLDVSRVVTGKLRLAPDTVTLRDVLDAALDLSRPHLEKARLDLAVDLPAGPVRLKADRVRLAQVFSNLLNNAAKYTEPGGRVSLTADLGAAAGAGGPVADSALQPALGALTAGVVRVRVRDTGVGIPADVLPHIFELFTQVDRTLNRSQGGLGVGLALVRRLVEMHGGTVSARSGGPGTGTEFTVELPVLQPE
ncbi:MAG: hybrid sensor histidine kinase/response regulator [Isosphaera sp.]|nr:hybrid sensor histidine kinase/response regulator [Isosphaera sp.]